MINKNSSWFRIIGIFGMILGIISCCTLIGVITGIPAIIGANKFLNMAKMTDSEITADKSDVITWSVVLCVCCFPFGLLALIPALNVDGKWKDSRVDSQSQPFEEKENKKLNKISNLKKLKDEGLISEEEFVKAKSKILTEN